MGQQTAIIFRTENKNLMEHRIMGRVDWVSTVDISGYKEMSVSIS